MPKDMIRQNSTMFSGDKNISVVIMYNDNVSVNDNRPRRTSKINGTIFSK